MRERLAEYDLLQEIQNILKDILERMPKKGKCIDGAFDWLDNSEFMQLMHISDRTAQTWRDKEIIKFTRIGKKFYYKKSEIQKMLMERFNKQVKL